MEWGRNSLDAAGRVEQAEEWKALMVLRASDAILDKNLRIIRRNLALLEAFMGKHREFFTWVKPRAGAIASIRFLGPLTSNELGAELAAEAGIGIKPAYCFTDVVAPERDYFRVGYGEEVFPAALEALDAFVEERIPIWRAAGRSYMKSRL